VTSLYRRLVGAVCHPLHTVRAGSAWLLQRPLAADASRTWSRLWFDRRPLTDLHPVTAIDRGETLQRRVLATPDVRVSGSTRRAIVLTTPARLSFQTTADRRSTLALWLAVAPESWGDPSRSVRVEVRIRAQGLTVAERSLTLAPGRRWRDRRWTKISADVHGPTAVDVEAHADPGAVTIAIGDPHVASPRSWAEVRVLAAAFAQRLARGGVRDTRRWARQTQRRETDADRYHAWCEAHTPDRHALVDMALRVPSTPDRPRFSILVPTYNTPDVLLEACVESVRAQVYPEWELVIADDGSTREETRRLLRRYEANDPRLRVVWNADNRGIAANTQSALAQATGQFVGLLDADDVLLPHALFRVAEAILARPDVDVVYTDEDKLELDGTRSDPYFKPDWSPDLFLSSMYACHFLVLRRSVVEAAGGFRSAFDGSQDYDLMLRVMERTDRIAHVPDVLYHWRKTPASASSTGAAKPWAFAAGQRALQDYADRNGLDAVVEQGGTPGLYRMHYRLRATPPVTVVVPILRPADRVASLLAARLGRAHYPDVELILAGPHRREIEAIAAQATRAVRAIDVEGTPGRVLNAGAAAAGGALLLFVAPWIEPLDDDWIAALVEHAQRPGIGIVGGKTFYPDGRLRHMGLIVGAHDLAGRPFDGYAGTWGGYFGNADAVRNCRAVSRACLMTRKALFDDAGGFDETLRADGLDVDYALRLSARGQRTLYTPFARVVEHVPYEAPPSPPSVEDVEHLRTRWGPALESDPYYNFHFVAADPDYRIRA
jgi:O-antigen biosynthesis protein